MKNSKLGSALNLLGIVMMFMGGSLWGGYYTSPAAQGQSLFYLCLGAWPVLFLVLLAVIFSQAKISEPGGVWQYELPGDEQILVVVKRNRDHSLVYNLRGRSGPSDVVCTAKDIDVALSQILKREGFAL